jgi:hypothetical protein
MEMNGQLGFLPTLEQAQVTPKPLSSLFRSRPGSPAIASGTGSDARFMLLSAIAVNVGEQLTAMGLKGDQHVRMFMWLYGLVPIALETRPGSSEREQRAAELVRQTRKPELCARVVELYFTEFERWRPKLFGQSA